MGTTNGGRPDRQPRRGANHCARTWRSGWWGRSPARCSGARPSTRSAARPGTTGRRASPGPGRPASASPARPARSGRPRTGTGARPSRLTWTLPLARGVITEPIGGRGRRAVEAGVGIFTYGFGGTYEIVTLTTGVDDVTPRSVSVNGPRRLRRGRRQLAAGAVWQPSGSSAAVRHVFALPDGDGDEMDGDRPRARGPGDDPVGAGRVAARVQRELHEGDLRDRDRGGGGRRGRARAGRRGRARGGRGRLARGGRLDGAADADGPEGEPTRSGSPARRAWTLERGCPCRRGRWWRPGSPAGQRRRPPGPGPAAACSSCGGW